ncbi:MAG: MW1434 family type I TA system toxin [Candidatus Dehalobacter alkaniphilus]
MNIYEAVKEAAKKSKSITRRSDAEAYKITPTNDPYWLCSMSMPDGSGRSKGWQPTLDDLIATDWEVV